MEVDDYIRNFKYIKHFNLFALTFKKKYFKS